MNAIPKTLILSQDYELFFGDSGSIEKCLIEPCDALVKFAQSYNLQFTFFVDAGMLVAMARHGRDSARLRGMLSTVRAHIASLAERGHEIALHVHPHWEDTRWSDDRWQFQGTRYQLQEFAADEVVDIFRRYSNCLTELSGLTPTSYRAGGFCVEPFANIGAALAEIGIFVDSSVVPGAILRDADKGFDFGSAPDKAYWEFDKSPACPSAGGPFLEIPITPLKLSRFFYWGRLIDRLGVKKLSEQFGDGTSKAIGRSEILRRLAMRSSVAELSIDDAKAAHLLDDPITANPRQVWHLMGHPKLVSERSINILDQFVNVMKIDTFETVGSFADRVKISEAGRACRGTPPNDPVSPAG